LDFGKTIGFTERGALLHPKGHKLRRSNAVHSENRSLSQRIHFGLVKCELAGLSGSSLRLIMNSLGKKDGEISGNQYTTEVA
jgi:hypothetical protein